MFFSAKCPKCDKPLTSVNIGDLNGVVGLQTKWLCVGYACPACHTLLSVQIDPIAIKTDTIAELVQDLKR